MVEISLVPKFVGYSDKHLGAKHPKLFICLPNSCDLRREISLIPKFGGIL